MGMTHAIIAIMKIELTTITLTLRRYIISYQESE